MNREITHKYFGTRLGEWLDLFPNSIAQDAVGLWQIIPVGRDSFGLHGNDLIFFAREVVVRLLRKGGVPVIAAADKNFCWERKNYGSSEAEIVDGIIEEWLLAGVDPDVEGVWFALPKMIPGKRSNS